MNKAAETLKSWIKEGSSKHVTPTGKKGAQSFDLTELSARNAALMLGSDANSRDFNSNTVIQACMRFIRRSVVQARLTVMARTTDGDSQEIVNHRFLQRMKRPNPFYLESAMRAMLATDIALTGNSYIVLTDTVGSSPLMQWVPSTHCKPIFTPGSQVWIDHYELYVDGRYERLSPDRVIHFRDGIDPSNHRLGYSALKSLLREVLTDNEATEYTYYILSNVGVPGMIISPTDPNYDGQALLANREEIEKRMDDKTRGAGRGSTYVATWPLDVKFTSFPPSDMVLDKVRDIPEERITAVIGIPAAVVGLGTGLQQTKVGATMKELREEAYEGCTIPLQGIMAEAFTEYALPRFGGEENQFVHYDNSNVKVFQEDENGLHQRVRDDWRAGLLTLGQALTMLGMKPQPGDDRIRIFDLTIGRFQVPGEAEKSAALQRIKKHQELFKSLQLDLGFEEHTNGKREPVAV